MKLEYSPWFSCSINPIHKGVYQVNGADWYRRWDGWNWFWGDNTPEKAAAQKYIIAGRLANETWRGITKASHDEMKMRIKRGRK